MPFACPECLARRSLEITLSLQLPSDSRSDDIALQIVECSNCKFRGAAVYEESRRGALESEAWDHRGYRVAEDDLQALVEAIQQCPAPSNTECQCPSHRSLGRKDAEGRWQGLSGLRLGKSFPMRLAS